MTPAETPAGARLHRRSWLTLALATLAGASARPARADDEADEVAKVRARAEEVGLGHCRVIRTRHYAAVGDASETFLKLCLRDCEGVAADYLDHYGDKGFRVAMPAGRMIIVVLSDDRTFARYLGTEPNPSIGGIYDRSNNRLHVYDYRSVGPQAPLRPGHANLTSLAHEATHQLTFNTGLLDLKRDAPLCVIEGLATYGEVRRFEGRTPPGQINALRLENLAMLRRQNVEWIPVADLLGDDKFLRGLEGGGKMLLGYAQSWLLIHYLMGQAEALPGFRAYLEALRDDPKPRPRLERAREHLGDLDALDEALERYGRVLLKRTY